MSVTTIPNVGAPASEFAGAEMTQRILEIDYVPVRYKVGGEGEPLILIHLPTCSLHCFNRNIAALTKHFRVYVVDLRPAVVLKTWRMRKLTLLDYLEEVLLKFMDALGIESANLLGAHKAGAVALYMAARHPDRIRRLVLYSPLGLSRLPGAAPVFKVLFFFMRWPGVPFMGRIRWIRRVVKWFDLRGVGQWRVQQFFASGSERNWSSDTRHLVRIYTTFSWPPDVWAYEVMIYTIGHLKYAPVAKILGDVGQRTLLLFGTHKYAVPANVIAAYSSAIKNCQVLKMDDTCLYPHYERAKEANEATILFLLEP